MLQPRRRKPHHLLVIAAVAVLLDARFARGVRGETEADRLYPQNFNRERRQDDATPMLLSPNTAQAPLGVLSSTARTFVQDGTTTEYATQLVATTAEGGRHYTQLLLTTSRVFYDASVVRPLEHHVRPTTQLRPHFVYPSKPFILPARQNEKVVNVFARPETDTYDERPAKTTTDRQYGDALDEILRQSNNVKKFGIGTQFAAYKNVGTRYTENEEDSSENQLKAKRMGDYFVGSGSQQHTSQEVEFNELKPAKVVRPVDGLPTFTIRHDFAPSAFSLDDEDEDTTESRRKDTSTVKNGRPRNGKALFRGGALNSLKKLDTVTYYGFADFSTTVGDTVIIFMPNTKSTESPSIPVTSISGAATLSNEQVSVVTTVKTFMSHTPGMVTRTVTGHSLSMQTALPTMVVQPETSSSGIRNNKALESSADVTEADIDEETEHPENSYDQLTFEQTSAFLAQEQEMFQSTTPDTVTSSEYEIEPSSVDIILSSTLEPETSEVLSVDDQESLVSTPYLTEIVSEPTELPWTFATTRTQTIPHGNNPTPEGLIKAIAGTRALDGTTTLFTSLIYGTYEAGKYTQVIHSTSSVFFFVDETKSPEPIESETIKPSAVLEIPPSSEPPEVVPTTQAIVDLPPATTEDTTTQITTDEAQKTTNDDETLGTVPVETTTTETNNEVANEIDFGQNVHTNLTDQTTIPVDESTEAAKEHIETNENANVVESSQSVLHYIPIQTSDIGQITQLIPSKVFKTFTYLTTFFIPVGPSSTTTSIRSREVTSEATTFLTRIIDIPKSSQTIQVSPSPTVIPENLATTLPEINIIPDTKEKADSELEISSTETPVDMLQEDEKPNDDATDTESATESTPSPTPAIKLNEAMDVNEEEIDLIFKTLYTTFTYLTTFFHEKTTSVSSREVVKTNVVTSTLDKNFLARETDPAVAGLFGRDDSLVTSEIMPTSVGVGRPTTQYLSEPIANPDTELFSSVIDSVDVEKELASPTPILANEVGSKHPNEEKLKTFYKTYTYFTTIFVDNETTVTSKTEVFTNIITPNSQLIGASETMIEASPSSKFQASLSSVLTDQLESPQSNIPNIIQPSREYTPLRSLVFKSTPHYSYSSTISRNNKQSEIINTQFQDNIEIADDEENKILSDGTPYLDREYAYSTTISRPHVTQSTDLKVENVEVSKSPFSSRGINEKDDGEYIERMVVESMSTDVTSSTSGGGQMLMLERNDRQSPLDDQISSESNTEEIQPSATLLLQTYFTTFTFFTTLYKGTSSSDIVSRLETVTNVVTETLNPQATTQLTETEDQSLPITYFTTYTYWTTLYKDGSSTITSREETVSNIITPTATREGISISTVIEPTPLNTIPEILPSELLEIPSSLGSDTSATATGDQSATTSAEELTSPTDNNGPATVYTTYTYFMTSYIGDSTVVNSRLETVSSILNSTIPQNDVKSGRSLGDAPPPEQLFEEIIKTATVEGESPPASLLPTGLLSTILTSQINNGTTTLYSTDVFGTYIDGFYAKILESSTTVVTPKPSPVRVLQTNLQPTGIVSLNEGRIIDADGVTTTFFTTKAIGTYIDNLYAQVVESSSSMKVDPEKQSLIAALITTVDPFRTGLVRIIDGSIVKDNTTTFYESKVVGTHIDGRYAQIIESTSSFKIDMTPTPVPPGLISASSVQTGVHNILPTVSVSTLPSPAVIESSIDDGESKTETDTDENSEDDEKEDDEESDEASSSGKSRVKSRLTFSTRKNTFTPQIRPFVIKSRNRPAFNPRHKTSATTITRNAITPTITASPAKSNERSGPGGGGSSRGRFSSNRRQSSQNNVANEIQPTLSSGSRRFSRNRGSSTPGVPHASSSYQGRARGRASTSGRIFATSASSSGLPSRRPSIYKSSAGRGSSSIFPGGAAGRLRIRPTLSSGLGRGFSSTVGVSTTPKSSDDTLSPDDTTLSVTEETDLYAEEDQETPTQPISTSTESLRRNTNPLLRLRRPLNLRTQQIASTTPRTSTVSSKKSSLPRKQSNENRSPSTTPKSLRPRPVSSIASRYKPVGNRPRPGNSLFPPRGLFRKPDQEDDEEESEKNEDEGEDEETDNNDEEHTFTDEEDIGDNDYEGSEKTESKTLAQPANRRSSNLYQPVQIRPFPRLLRKPRTKRQAEYGTRREGGTGRTYGRFRRPGSKSGVQAQDRADTAEETVVTPDPPKSKSSNTGRFIPRQRNQAAQNTQKIRPTASSTNSGRSQFTLREKDTSTNTRSNFKRPSTTSSPRRRQNKNSRSETTSAPPARRPKPPRLRTHQKSQSHTQKTQSYTQQTDTTFTRANPPRYRNTNANTNTNRGRGNARTRYRSETTDFDTFTFTPSSFDGTITVTHQVPTEVTIPIINGKVTEYRNIITASPSTEVLGPHQYTATIGKEGNTVYVLTSEATGTLPGGVTEITQFFLRDTPTTSVIFTPTVIRGRKTSFSHIVPSTVYDVEQVVSTLQPQISPNAPLANILLSQLLLGNLGLQPNINPLLALNNNNNNNGPPPSPTTEYKTRTTTYVTTVTKGTSTVIPLTFRGKEILTTIVDQSEEVITATEFLTDTIVVTPTAANNQLNSLLLPALLQAQLLGQNQPQTTSNPLLGLQQQLLQSENAKLLQNDVPTLDDDVRRRGIQTRQRTDDDADRLARESESDELLENDNDSLQAAKDDNQSQHSRSNQRKRIKASDPKPPDPPPAPAETSVVTLYVSGRRPGEFSTVLSTVTLGDEASIRKREAPNIFDTTTIMQLETEKNNIKDRSHAGAIKVDASKFPDLGSSFNDQDNEIVDSFMSAMSEASADISTTETQSLESMVGDVSRYVSVVQTSMNMHTANPSTTHKTSERDAAASATKNIHGTGHFLLNSPAEFPPLQRKGIISPHGGSRKYQALIGNPKCYNSFSSLRICSTDSLLHGNKSLKRTIRDLTEQSSEEQHYTTNNMRKRRRKIIRIRVPISRDRNYSEEEKDIFTVSEAQRKENVPDMDTSQPNEDFFKDEDHHKPAVRRVKVIRNRKLNLSDNNKETKNEARHVKRILVARRKRPVGLETKPTLNQENIELGPTDQTVNQKLLDESLVRDNDSTTEKNEMPNSSVYSRHPASPSRKLIRVTKKHPLSELPVTGSTYKRRIIMTKRRLAHKTQTSILLTETVPNPTSTSYSYQHTLMSEKDQERSTDVDTIETMSDVYMSESTSPTAGTKQSSTDTIIHTTVATTKSYSDENTDTIANDSKHIHNDFSPLYGSEDNDQATTRSTATPISESVIEPTIQESQYGIFGSQTTLLSREQVLMDHSSILSSELDMPVTQTPDVFISPNPTEEQGIIYMSTYDENNKTVAVSLARKENQEEQINVANSTELHESDTEPPQESTTEISEDKAESSSVYEGPRFIRPTRFSITRKPGRTKASFSGQKRRNSSPSTTHKATSSSNYKTSYRGRKSSSRAFGRGNNAPRGFRPSTRLPKIEATDTSHTYGSVEQTSASSLLNIENENLHASVTASSVNPVAVASESIITETPPLPNTVTTIADSSHDYTEMPQSITTEYSVVLPTTSRQHEDVQTDANISVAIDTSKEHTENHTEQLTQTLMPVLVTHVTTFTRLRTYTFIVTRVDGTDEYITSTTEVKPHVTQVTLTEPEMTTIASTQGTSGRSLMFTNLNEARLHLATKIMSNGVEVIVAGDRSTMPGDPEVMRILTSSLARPITLAPSTLSDQMVMLLPQSESQVSSSSSLPCRELVTKTYLTTYTYMTTFLQGGSTTVSSSKKVVSNVVTEEASALVTLPPPAYTLTGSPSMSTGVFHTTYTYLNTVMDGDQPLVLTSKHTVANTVTAPEEHFAQVSHPGVDTNTYLNTVILTKTMTDDSGDVSVTSTNDVVTQVVITESEHSQPISTRTMPQGSFTDIIKTYFVTYTYYNTLLQDGSTVVQSDIAISSDVVTEKVFVPQKKTSIYQEILHEPSKELGVHATKTYPTTFTHYTTLLQDAGNDQISTVMSSRTRVVDNMVSETVPLSLLPSDYMDSLANSMREESTDTIVATATLSGGQEMMVTAIERDKNTIPTSVQNVLHSTSMGQPELVSSMEESSGNPSNVITGSTIIFFDSFDQESSSEYLQPTPALTNSYVQTMLLQQDGSTMKPIEPLPLTTEVFTEESSSNDTQNPLTNTVTQTSVDETHITQTIITTILATSTVAPNGATIRPGEQVIMMTQANGSVTMIPVSDPANKRPTSIAGDTSGGSEIQVSDLLSLGSLGINGLNALGPVINAMAGIIQSNLNRGDLKRRNDTINLPTITSPNPIIPNEQPHPVYVPDSSGNSQSDSGVRSPIYIPVGGLAAEFDVSPDDIVAAESQNYENRLNLNGGNEKWLSQPSDVHERKRPSDVIMGRPTMESPLLSDGIPISPGQVITANSDVIIGKPAIMGPRPPKLNNNNDVPIGMKPPPLPHSWPPKLHSKPVIPHIHLPFQPMPEENVHFQPTLPFVTDHPPRLENSRYNIPIPDNHNIFNFGPNKPLELSSVQTVFLGKPIKHSHQEHHSNANIIIHGIPEPPMAHAEPIPIGIPTVDRVSGQPMLVNIQPSQVANVLIPHGGSTESIYALSGGAGSYYDKSPFPFPETSPEFVGLDDSGQHSVGTVHNEKSPQTEPELHIPAGSINVDISPGQGINVGVAPVHVVPSGIITESSKTDVYSPGTIFDSPYHHHHPQHPNHNHPQHHQSIKPKLPVPSVPSGFMIPPPPPSKSKLDPATGRPPIVIPLNEERIEDNSNSHKKDNPYGNDKMEGEIQVVQESIRRPLRPGQIPIELQMHNSISTHRPIFFTGVSDSKPTSNFHNSPVQSRPYTSFIEKPPPPPPPPPIPQPQSPPAPISNKKYNIARPAELPHLPHVYVSPQQPAQRPNNIPHNIAVLGRPQPVESYATVDINTQLQNKKPVPPNFGKPIVPNYHHLQQVNFGENTGTQFDGNKHQNKLPDLNVHLMPPPLHPTIQHGGRPPLTKFGSTMENKDISQNKRPDEKIQRPKFPPNVSPSVDLDAQSNTPKPFYQPPPLSQPILVPHKPQTQTESSHKNSEVLSQRPDVIHEESNNRPEPPFIVPTKSEPQSTGKPSWGRPALHEIPSPSRPLQTPVHVQEEISTTKNSVVTYKPFIANFNPLYINKPIIHPSSVHAITQVPSQETLISRFTNSIIIGTTTIHDKSTVRPTKHDDDVVLQTVAIGKPIPQVDISPTTVKKPSTDITQWTRVEPESSFTEEGHQPTSTVPMSSSSTTDVVNVSTLLSGSETYSGELFTRPATTVTETVSSYRPTEFENDVPEADVFEDDDYEKVRPDLGVASSNDETIVFLGDEEPYIDKIPSYTLPTRYVTHTQTLTVTTTETIVVSSLGKVPSTKTLVLTKTQTSTVVDTVTETRTLMKPTSVTATVTTTVSTTLLGTPPAVNEAPTERTTKQSTATRKPETGEENESFFVVVNDQKPGREGTVNNAIFLGGVLVPGTSRPVDDGPPATSCRPDCSATRNELCQQSEGQMHCVCRPGFARMFPDQPCKPTYTYNMKLPLERHGKMKLQYDASLEQAGSLKHSHLSEATREGLDRMVMQSDLRDVYHGVAVSGFQPTSTQRGVLVNFYVQLSDNTDEERLREVFKKSLRTTNYSLGGTEVFADKKLIELLEAEDFNECSSAKFHDCSENAYCFNLRGTYTCSCKEGYADLSENSLFPGRVCSAELIGCEKCHYHGSCHSQEDDQVTCECFQWYTGENCHINLKVLLIALVTIGALLLALLLVCIVLACLKKCRATANQPHRSAPGFLRYRGTKVRGDKRAMIQDSSSEGSVDNGPVSFIAPPPQPVNLRPIKKPSAMKKVVTTVEPAETIPSFTDQRDRSLTVMIPRAKYRPVPPMSPMLTMSTFGAPEKRAIAQEQKLISYLENGGKQENRNKPVIPIKKQSTVSNQRSEPAPSRKTSYSQLRKQSTSGTSKVCGALVSAGFEVSATVNHKTTADGAPEIHSNTLASNESEHTTLRTGDRTVSEARSCDETTIQAPTKTLHSHYGSKNGSNTLNNDEAHTMAERDLGSTLLMPQTHLYKPDRGSDISNFDSL